MEWSSLNRQGGKASRQREQQVSGDKGKRQKVKGAL